ncbi:MAG: hypothetical protein KBB78_01090 [Candidatus Pacebacteria bacterium]|nr:hypothetical protein [Candidatus Paceibacterota bacterium]
MNPELENQVTPEIISKKHPVFEVTTLSKYFALFLFVTMPFIGGLVGYHVAPVETSQVAETNVQKFLVNQATSSAVSNNTTFPLGKTIELTNPSSEYIDFEKSITTFLKIPSIGEGMPITVTRVDKEHVHVVASISMDILPSNYIRAFLVKDSTHEIVREISEGPEPGVTGPEMWVLSENNEARLASIEGDANEATKLVLYDYVKNIKTVLYEENDPSVQLAKGCELGCFGKLSWTGLNTQTLIFERYSKGVWPDTTFIETKEIKLVQ